MQDLLHSQRWRLTLLSLACTTIIFSFLSMAATLPPGIDVRSTTLHSIVFIFFPLLSNLSNVPLVATNTSSFTTSMSLTDDFSSTKADTFPFWSIRSMTLSDGVNRASPLDRAATAPHRRLFVFTRILALSSNSIVSDRIAIHALDPGSVAISTTQPGSSNLLTDCSLSSSVGGQETTPVLDSNIFGRGGTFWISKMALIASLGWSLHVYYRQWLVG